MCLALPGQLVSIMQDDTGRYGDVSFSGLKKRCDLALVPEAAVGDYLIVHAGFALALMDEDEARASLEDFESMQKIQAAPP